MSSILNEFVPITEWGAWCRQMALLSDAELAEQDLAALNLRCAEDLPGTSNELLRACLEKVNDWADLVDRLTQYVFPRFTLDPESFDGSEAQFRVIAMADCLQRQVGIKYNSAFADGEYDASDSRNLFIHGILMGFGGTCVSMPVLYCAIGRRLGYPLCLAETREHYFCRWDDHAFGEQFCFDATGQGCSTRSEEYYRHWPKPITPSQERDNGFIRAMTPWEELAAFAETRGNCLLDNFRFEHAVESFCLAHKIAPHKRRLHDAWGLAVYTVDIWTRIRSLPDTSPDTPIDRAVARAADDLRGPDVGLFRKPAADNVIRIIRNRQRRESVKSRDIAFQEFIHSGIEESNHV